MRTLIAVTTLLVLAPAASAQQEDDLPPLPAPKRAVFDVIVEGNGVAERKVDGEEGRACGIRAHLSSRESYTYLRGRGLRVVFTQLGLRRTPVTLTRAGRRTPASFNVRARIDSSAEGSAELFSRPECGPRTETVGDEPECVFDKLRSATYRLTYTGGKLRLGLAQPPRAPFNLLNECGATSLVAPAGPPQVSGWRSPPALKAAALPIGRIFGKRRAFRVTFDRVTFRQQWDFGSLRAFEEAWHKAVVRFVRVSG